MELEIKHLSRYTYSEEVFVEPHHLYFYPGHRSYFKLLEHDIKVDPVPSGMSARLDAENNAYHQCWFNHTISKMEVIMEMRIQTVKINPFDFLVETNPKRDHKEALALYMTKESLKDEILLWVRELSTRSGDHIITFLTFLNAEINTNWEHEERLSEDILTPSECFNARKGSCRDLSWMMIQMLRNLDIPARFVSGYAYNPELQEGHELHAWLEAWIPGAGWVGMDPSAGLWATESHIPICSSYIPQNTFPVQGSYRGDAKAELYFEVSIQAI